MSPFAPGVYIAFGGGVLLFVLSFFAKRTGGDYRPLEPLGPQPFAERELSHHAARYNDDPKRAMPSLAAQFFGWGVLSSLLDVFFG